MGDPQDLKDHLEVQGQMDPLECQDHQVYLDAHTSALRCVHHTVPWHVAHKDADDDRRQPSPTTIDDNHDQTTQDTKITVADHNKLDDNQLTVTSIVYDTIRRQQLAVTIHCSENP